MRLILEVTVSREVLDAMSNLDDAIATLNTSVNNLAARIAASSGTGTATVGQIAQLTAITTTVNGLDIPPGGGTGTVGVGTGPSGPTGATGGTGTSAVSITTT